MCITVYNNIKAMFALLICVLGSDLKCNSTVQKLKDII